MAKPLRIEYPGDLYHITSRGNAKQKIYRDDNDRIKFLDILWATVKRYNWLCHVFCLMDNHYHLLIETPDGNLSRGMRQLNGVYTQRYNQGHKKTGHIFQGRYRAILVDKENYLLALSRYIVLNPIRASMVNKPEGWKWSSYFLTIGIKKAPDYLTVNWILKQFGRDKKKAKNQYKTFVRAGIKTDTSWKNLKAQILLGSEGFIEKVKKLLIEKKGIVEIPKSQRYLDRPELINIFNKGANTNRSEGLPNVLRRLAYNE